MSSFMKLYTITIIVGILFTSIHAAILQVFDDFTSNLCISVKRYNTDIKPAELVNCATNNRDQDFSWERESMEAYGQIKNPKTGKCLILNEETCEPRHSSAACVVRVDDCVDNVWGRWQYWNGKIRSENGYCMLYSATTFKTLGLMNNAVALKKCSLQGRDLRWAFGGFKNALWSEDVLPAGQGIYQCKNINVCYRLTMQYNGDLVLKTLDYYKQKYVVSWRLGTDTRDENVYKRPFHLKMQPDNNLVMYDKNGKGVWSTGTHSNVRQGRPRFEMQGDGNFVVYDAKGDAVWDRWNNPSAAGTSPLNVLIPDAGINMIDEASKQYSLTFQIGVIIFICLLVLSLVWHCVEVYGHCQKYKNLQ